VSKFAGDLVLAFLIALGVVLGGSFMGSLGALLINRLPLWTMHTLAEKLKIWAMVTALGGTFATIRTIESGLFEGQLGIVAKQLLFIFSAFAGAHLGYLLVTIVAGEK